MRRYSLNVALVLAAILVLSCTSPSVPAAGWPDNETLSFGISDSIDNVRVVLNLGMDGKMELTYAEGQNKIVIEDTLSKGQADTLRALVEAYNNEYMQSVHKYEREDLQNNPRIYTQHWNECLDAMEYPNVTADASDFAKEGFYLSGTLRPVIMYMHIGNRMCYIYGDVRNYYEREGKYGKYNNLNRFVFTLLGDKLREHGTSSKYAEGQ